MSGCVRGLVLLALGLGMSLAAAANAVVTEIKVLSNRADLISGGDALVEVVPAPPPGTVIMAGATNVTSDFALRSNGRYMGLVTGLAVGNTVLTVTQPTSSGASITITNHPTEGPVFTGSHLQPWDCTTDAQGLGQPSDANCNVAPLVEWLCSTGGAFASCDPNNPPANVQILTLNGNPVRAIVRRESGAINRGLYAFAVLHDPAQPQAPWIRQDGWSGKLYYPFGVSCNTNQTQGSSKASTVTVTNRLKQGWAIATTSLNELGHHCNPIISAETAMMTKERFIEQYGEIRYTISTGASGGSIGQLQVSNAYPGITNGLIPSLTYPDVWSTAIEVADCFLTEKYWATASPFTPEQKSAVDDHGPTPPGPGLATSCEAWVALFVPSGIPSHGCFSGSTLPTTSTPDPARDYNPATNPNGCRATVNDLQANIWGRRAKDQFARRPIDNTGVQYGLEALNFPVGDLGKITFAQFLDLNATIGGIDIDGVPTVGRTRTDAGVPRIAYRSGNIEDGRGLAQAAIIDLPSAANAEIHTPYHAYALEARLAAIGHEDNHAIWHAPGLPLVYPAGFEETAFTTMDAWLTAVEAAGGITPTGMDPAKVKANRPATAYDSCWTSSLPMGPLVQGPLSGCAAEVYGDSRLNAGMSAAHDNLQCQLKPVAASDYAGAFPPLTAVDIATIQAIFSQGVCDYSKPALDKVPSVQWLTYENGPGGQPLGPPPTSTPFP